MRSCSKLVSQILAIIIVVDVNWCASQPVVTNLTEKAVSMALKDQLCSSTPTLNLSEVCVTSRESQTDLSNSVLTNFINTCDHAAYLVRRICEVVQSNNNLSMKTDNEIGESFIPPADNGTFCVNFLKHQKQFGYANQTVKTTLTECITTCILETGDSYKVAPKCNFISWSWKFLERHTKESQGSNQVQTSSAKLEKIPNEQSVHQPGEVAPPGSVQDAAVAQKPDSGTMKKDDIVQTPIKPDSEEITAGNAEPGKARKSENPAVDEENPAESDASEPNSQANAPPVGETNIDQMEPKQEASVKPKEGDDTSTNDGNDADDQVQEEKKKGKLQEVDPRDEDKGAKEAGRSQQTRGPTPFPIEDDDDANEADHTDEKEVEREKIPVEDILPKESNRVLSNVDDSEDSHVFVFFVVGTFICILFYFIYLNKRKIIAMALEGKKGRHSTRRRPTSASYQKLDNKLDEVMASNPQPSKTHVIY